MEKKKSRGRLEWPQCFRHKKVTPPPQYQEFKVLLDRVRYTELVHDVSRIETLDVDDPEKI